MIVRALSLWQPWAAWLAAGVKPIENRPWAPPEWMIGQLLVIQSAKRRPTLAERIWPVPGPMPEIDPRLFDFGYMLGAGILTGCVTESDDPWFTGPYGWQLRDVVSFRDLGVGLTGRQRLFRLRPEQERAVVLEYQRRTA